MVSSTETNYSYVYDGGRLCQMTITTTVTANGETTTQAETLIFTYNASGVPQTITYGNTTYLYVTNLQGDVVAILDTAGNAVVEYAYDAWGNLLSTTGSMAVTLGQYNPLRYRGYVYDTETGFYYLQSRYYDPELGRFINADILVSTGQGLLGNNMFAYCRNNPVNRKDTSGTYDVCNMDTAENGSIFDDYANLRGGGGGVSAGVAGAVGAVVGTAVSAALVYSANKKKPVNLPSSKKVTIDMDHVISGHTPGGDRNPDGKKSVFWGLTAQEIAKAIYEAYKYSSKLQTQGDRIQLQGWSNSFDLLIEMWINTVTYVIETAYPRG